MNGQMERKFLFIFLIFFFISEIFLANDIENKNISSYMMSLEYLKNKSFQEKDTSLMITFSHIFIDYDYCFLTIPPLITCGVGYYTGNEKLIEVSQDAFLSSVISGGITLLTKIIVGRERPNRGNDPFSFKLLGPLSEGSAYASFPSGHAALSWALYTPYAEEYSRWIYLIPTTVSLSRVYFGEHWPMDVFVGSVIGYFIAVNIDEITSELF